MTINLEDYAREISEIISIKSSKDKDLMKDPYFIHTFYKTTRRFLSVMSEEEKESKFFVKYVDLPGRNQLKQNSSSGIAARIDEAYRYAKGIVENMNLPQDIDY